MVLLLVFEGGPDVRQPDHLLTLLAPVQPAQARPGDTGAGDDRGEAPDEETVLIQQLPVRLRLLVQRPLQLLDTFYSVTHLIVIWKFESSSRPHPMVEILKQLLHHDSSFSLQLYFLHFPEQNIVSIF